MDNNSDSSFADINTDNFFYIGNSKGCPVCNNRFTTADAAAKHFKKAMKKPNYKCYVFMHSVAVCCEISD
jgi:hypothetical protein